MKRDEIIKMAREAGFGEGYASDSPEFTGVCERFACLIDTAQRKELLGSKWLDAIVGGALMGLMLGVSALVALAALWWVVLLLLT